MSRYELTSKCVTLTLISAALIACGSDDSAGETPHTTPDPLALPCGDLNSGFDGDERCILPPDPADGIQLHVGPKDYNDDAEIAKYVLGPYQEKTECYAFKNPNEGINFFKQVYRMRKGSHHLIIHTMWSGTPRPDGWGSCEGSYSEGYTPIGGTQNGVSQFPPDGVVAPEDELLYRPLPKDIPMLFEMHFYNTTDKSILREAWVNFENKKVEEGQKILGGILMMGGFNMYIPPGEKQTLSYQCENSVEGRRIVSIFGHRHAHTPRFSVWVNRSGTRELLYEDFDWEETQELTYNSRIQNPEPDRSAGVAGGMSGQVLLSAGDLLEWECEIDNFTNPSSVPLQFRNDVDSGEMCNVFGSMVSTLSDAPDIYWYCGRN